jgi:hypothetical protein
MTEAVAPVANDAMRAALLGDIAIVRPAAEGAVSSPRGLVPLVHGGRIIVTAATIVALSSGTVALASGTPRGMMASALSRPAPFVTATWLEAPDLRIDPDAETDLKQRESLVRKIIALLRSETRRHQIRSAGVRISHFNDPEEGDSQLVITQKVDAGPDVALAYWDELGQSIQRLADTLVAQDARILSDYIAVNIEWNDGDASVQPD